MGKDWDYWALATHETQVVTLLCSLRIEGSVLYEDLFRRLEQEQVRYVVAGGVAMVLHGVVRFSADLDLIAVDPFF